VCYNVIYNEFPTSLLDEKEMIEKAGFSLALIEFVDEDKERIIDVLDCYLQSFVHESKCNVDYNYTKGHFKRGVE
jgi:putative protease